MGDMEEIHKLTGNKLGTIIGHNVLTLNWSIVLLADVDVMCATSIHLEWLSTRLRKLLPSFSAKPMCTLCHTRVVHLHRYRGALGGTFHTDWQTSQFFTISSISASKLGHHRKLQAMAFMATVPGCCSCNPCNTQFLNNGRMITRIPHKTHP